MRVYVCVRLKKCITLQMMSEWNLLQMLHTQTVNSCFEIFFITFFNFFLQSTPVGTTIFRNIQAQDMDAGVNGLVEYFLVEGTQNISAPDTLTASDGYGVFAISYPHQGQVSVDIQSFNSLLTPLKQKKFFEHTLLGVFSSIF